MTIIKSLQEDEIEIAARIAPELFAVLSVVQELRMTFPIESRDLLSQALFPDGKRFKRSGLAFSRDDFERYFLPEHFPIKNATELVTRGYAAIMAAHMKMHEEPRRDRRNYRAALVSPGPKVFCRAGTWTKVIWGNAIIGIYAGAFDNQTTVQWRRYSVFPPWYTWGTHDTKDDYSAVFICDPYADFWFNPKESVTVSWDHELEACVPENEKTGRS